MRNAGHGLAQHRSLLRLLGLLVIPAIGALAAFQYAGRNRHVADNENLVKLAHIVGDHRLTRARLSGGFEYAPCQTDSSGDRLVRGLVCELPTPTSWASVGSLRKFAGSMHVRGQSGEATPDLHTIGIWDLVWGHADDAVADLREAVRREPLNARALNDLAVALTEFAQRHDDPSALTDAFVAADSAVRLDSTLREARFTHALLLEHLYLRVDAVEAWTRYLRLDGTSPWAREAKAHLIALEPRTNQWKEGQARLQQAVAAADSQTIRAIIADNPSETRVLIQDRLGTWGTAVAAGDATAGRPALDFARALAEALSVVTGDAFLKDAVAAIEHASAEKNPGRVRALANGHASLANGIKQFGDNVRGASTELATARKLLAYGASPMTDWALLYQARAQLYVSQDSALKWLTAIRDSSPARYLVLRSRAAQYQGFVYDSRSDYMPLLAAYDSAVSWSRTTSDPEITIRVASWLAQSEAVLRGRAAGWRTRYSALAATRRYPTSSQPTYAAFDYAGLATANEAPRLSLRYCDESIRIARQMSDSGMLAYALRRRAERLAEIGQTELARADIAAAVALARRIADTVGRAPLVADVELSHAYIALRSAPAGAQTELRRVIDEYRAKKYQKGLAKAYLYLAQSRAAAGMIDSARAMFDSATNLMQRQRATVTNYAERAAFLDEARAVIDQVVAFHAGRSGREAFEYFEGTRSRVLLEQVAQSGGQTTDQPHAALAALQRGLTNDDVVLSYAVLPRELLIWVVGRNRFEQRRVAVTARELEGMVGQLQRSLLDASGEPDLRVSQRLYQLLVDSAGPVARGANLIVIPDRWLHFVPFAALRDSTTGHFLVREHAVSYAASATLLASSLARAPQRLSHSSKILAIGNPAFDPRQFQLPLLPAADGEARRIAALYPDHALLTGRDATDAALERLAPAYDILHFAGHAIVGRDAPQLSHLVLASDGRSDGAVFSTEIAKWKLPRTRLVILSGCNTADGKLSATEGASSLARAFFAAGVPAVLSSFWAIDDDDTADFFVEFHRRLAQGDPAPVALRETQIKWLGRDRPVRSWAAFQLFGG